MNKIILGGYIGLMVGFAWNSVGQMTDPPHPFPWYLPVIMFLVICPPAILGYLIGKEDIQRQKP